MRRARMLRTGVYNRQYVSPSILCQMQCIVVFLLVSIACPKVSTHKVKDKDTERKERERERAEQILELSRLRFKTR